MKMKKIIIPVAALIMFATCKKTEGTLTIIVPKEKVTNNEVTCNSPNNMAIDLTLLSNSE